MILCKIGPSPTSSELKKNLLSIPQSGGKMLFKEKLNAFRPSEHSLIRGKEM